MDDNATNENQPAADFNKIDLSQLQGFNFGTQWTQDKTVPGDRRSSEDRPRRDGGGFDRRDRRGFRRPAGEGGGDAGPGGPGGPGRRDEGGERRFRGGGPGGFRDGPRREGGPRDGGQREGGGERGGFRRGPGGPQFGGRGAPQFGPYESPYFTATFYPEDASFNTLVQTIRKSCRTVELFEIARTVVAKNDRFVVVLGHRAPAGAPATAEAAAKPVFHISVPDGLPFETDEAAVAHVMANHLERFFDRADVEVEAPKGSYQVINRCGVTGELLGPPNYHRYNQMVQQHYTSKLSGRMGPEAFRSRIETVRDPELVNQWLAKMKKATRYTWKLSDAAAAPAAPASETPTEAPAADAPAPAAPAAPFFDTLEDARLHLLTHAREKVVRTAENARFTGRLLETLPPGEIHRAVEGALERQRRFPLDTANGLRGRLRREHFTIFKKGSKGVSYVCAVKRKFRVPGQTFSDSIGALIAYIEANPMVRAGELPAKFLGIKPAAAPAGAAPSDAAASDAPAVPAVAPEQAVPKAEEFSIDDRARLARLQGDLVWLVREGYVTEFIDGRLFAPPVMVEARKKEIEAEEHDPENFPEAPASAEAPAAESAPAEAAAVAQPVADAAPASPEAAPETPAEGNPPAGN